MVCQILFFIFVPMTLLYITDDTVLPICCQTVKFLQSAFGAVLYCFPQFKLVWVNLV